jgi:hypothetical protein
MTLFDGTTPSSITSRIYMYDLYSATPFAFKQLVASVAGVTVANNTGFGQLQLGPDNKIYIARSNKNYIDVITDPNNATSVGYKTYPDPACPVFTTAGVTCGFGLPNKVLTSQKIYSPVLNVNTKFCQGTFLTATGSYTGETPANTYWEIVECDAVGNPIPGGYSFGSWYPGVVSSFSFPGSNVLACNKYYRIKMAFGNACNANWAEAYKVTYRACNPTPVISGPPFLCLGSSTSLCVNYPVSTLNTILWNTGQTTQCITVSPTVNTNYSVTIKETARIGCSATASYNLAVQTCTVNNRTIGSLNEENNSDNNTTILVSPNPTTDFITVNTGDETEKNVYVYDVIGKQVYKNEGVTGSDLNIDLSSFNSGIYSLKIIRKGQTIMRKIVKE